MRWKTKQKRKGVGGEEIVEGEERVNKVFPIIPRTFEEDTRWLETTYIRQRSGYLLVQSCESQNVAKEMCWIDIAWATKEEYRTYQAHLIEKEKNAEHTGHVIDDTFTFKDISYEVQSVNLNINDIFGHGCADTYTISEHNLSCIKPVYEEYGAYALYAYVAYAREQKPLKDIKEKESFKDAYTKIKELGKTVIDVEWD
jgi:hypothetical protein